MKIVLLGNTFPASRDVLQSYLPTDEIVEYDPTSALEKPPSAAVLVPRMCKVGPELMDASRPRLIHQFGVGLEGVDLAAAASRGIAVANVPGAGTGNAAAVAEVALLHWLALTRRYLPAQVSLQSGRLGTPMGQSAEGKTVVVLGLGAVGCATATRLRSFGVQIVGVGRQAKPSPTAKGLLDCYHPVTELLLALSKATALFVCCSLTPETRNLIGSAELGAMPRGGFLINVARGPIVEYDALMAALVGGQLAGAGLDVFWSEPVNPTDPILRQNVSVTPHLGGVTAESYADIARLLAENVERLRRGETLRNVVAS